jgi:hypothetical protein
MRDMNEDVGFIQQMQGQSMQTKNKKSGRFWFSNGQVLQHSKT